MPHFPDRAAFASDQLAKLRALLAAVGASNPFYQSRLKSAGLATGAVASLADFTARMPFTTKQEIAEDQIAHPPYGSNLTYPLERYTRFSQTSGTTATPMRWLDTPESWEWMVGNWLEVFRASGVRAGAGGDRIFFAFSFGPFLGFWTAFDAATKLGCLAIPAGGWSSDTRLRAIIDNRATVVCCTPTYAMRLGESAVEEKIDLRNGAVKHIIVGGEAGGSIPATRSHIESLWPGARVHDHHGMTEVGPVSFECPARRGVLHVIEASYLAEVVDPASGAAITNGQMGELVLTTLGRLGSPLLRYRTGDIVRPGADGVCACGRSDLALEGGILGRVDDMITVRGVNVFPSAVEDVMRSIPGVAEYRVQVTTERAMNELAIQIEPHAGHDGWQLVDQVDAALRNALSLRVAVTVAAGKLPRYEMKAQRWVRV